MEFVSIDVETANADMASLCQVGIACYDKHSLVDEWETLVDPEDDFDFFNVLIHGITEDTIRGAPKFPEITTNLSRYLDNQICVTHTSFDRISIYQALFRYKFDQMPVRWLDSALVARRAWDEFAHRGWGLRNICKVLGYSFHHHDALEDAKAAGYIMLKAIEKTEISAEEWLKRVKQPINPDLSSIAPFIARDGNPEGPLFGEVVVFTGALSLRRREAAELAAQIGCRVDDSVTSQTTLLVVGDQDIRKLAGHEKSSKHRKAEELITKGQSIRILRESDFKELVNSTGLA